MNRLYPAIHMPFPHSARSNPVMVNPLRLLRATGILLILLVILSNIPYVLLIQTFGYDDILREPVDVVLTRFQAGEQGSFSPGSALDWLHCCSFLQVSCCIRL